MGNRITTLFGIKRPIIQGGMGNTSDPILASAISNAGGLGTIGAGTMSVEEAEVKTKALQVYTDYPFCVNIPISVHPNVHSLVEMVIRRKVPIVTLSAGNPNPLIPQLKEWGIKVICVSSSVRQATKAEQAGADVIVCEGYEAAGINALNESTSMALIPQIVEHVSVPVIAAGGIADGRGLAAAISLGATGVQMGTRFIATKEADFHDNYKQAILNATDESTTIVGRGFQKIRRVMKGKYVEGLLNLEKENRSEEFADKTSEFYHKIGAIQGDGDKGFMNSGQISGLIDECPSVAELLEGMVQEAKTALMTSMKIL